MSYSISEIATMVIDPAAGPDFVNEKISNEWESSKVGKTLLECLNEVVNIYFELIDTEIGYDKNRKLKAIEAELSIKIRNINEA